jgi:hypothetical protein
MEAEELMTLTTLLTAWAQRAAPSRAHPASPGSLGLSHKVERNVICPAFSPTAFVILLFERSFWRQGESKTQLSGPCLNPQRNGIK